MMVRRDHPKCQQSQRLAVQLRRQFGVDIRLVDVDDKTVSKPGWLKGVPTLHDDQQQRAWAGAAALQQLECMVVTQQQQQQFPGREATEEENQPASGGLCPGNAAGARRSGSAAAAPLAGQTFRFQVDPAQVDAPQQRSLKDLQQARRRHAHVGAVVNH